MAIKATRPGGDPFHGRSEEQQAATKARLNSALGATPRQEPSRVVEGGTATSDFTDSGESIRGRATPGGALVKGTEPKKRGSAPSRPNSVDEDSWSAMSSQRQNKVGNHSPGQAPQRTVNAAARQRSEWEASDVGQARTRDMSALTADRPAHERRTPGQAGFERNYDRKTVGPRHYDEQLPGLSDPNAAPRPPRWHELSAEQQANTTAALAEHGTSIEQISKDIGAQYDQGVARAEQRDGFGADAHAEHFYSTGDPRKKIDSSAAALGIPSTIHAHMNAITSPNTKFEGERGQTMADPEGGKKRVANPRAGETYYPNDEAAVHAVKHVQNTGSAAGITNELSTTDPAATGKSTARPANVDKAARSFEQYEAGVPVGEWETSKRKKDKPDQRAGGPFDSGPKTGPYSNSWNDTHPQFFVADVHSGGGGAFPHLSAEKPIIPGKFDSNDKPVREKSQRELALEKVPFAHTAIDEANRQAMFARNLPSVRSTQEIQWGEEQNQRKETGSIKGGVSMPPKRERSNESGRQPTDTPLPGMGGEEPTAVVAPAPAPRKGPIGDTHTGPEHPKVQEQLNKANQSRAQRR